jgi:hypothetical protein
MTEPIQPNPPEQPTDPTPPAPPPPARTPQERINDILEAIVGTL